MKRDHNSRFIFIKYIMKGGTIMPNKRKKLFGVRKFRDKYSITQDEIAEFLCMCRSNYANIEAGRTSLKLEYMLDIHEYINKKAKEHGDTQLTLDDLFCD